MSFLYRTYLSIGRSSPSSPINRINPFASVISKTFLGRIFFAAWAPTGESNWNVFNTLTSSSASHIFSSSNGNTFGWKYLLYISFRLKSFSITPSSCINSIVWTNLSWTSVTKKSYFVFPRYSLSWRSNWVINSPFGVFIKAMCSNGSLS